MEKENVNVFHQIEMISFRVRQLHLSLPMILVVDDDDDAPPMTSDPSCLGLKKLDKYPDTSSSLDFEIETFERTIQKCLGEKGA
jgi:hypothetical protein